MDELNVGVSSCGAVIDDGSTIKFPSFLFNAACLRTEIILSIRTVRLNLKLKITTTLPLLPKYTEFCILEINNNTTLKF